MDGWLEDTAGLTVDPAIAVTGGGDLSDDDEEEHSLFFNIANTMKDACSESPVHILVL